MLNAENYGRGVQMAVSLGEDTDTNAAVAGGLLALHFGANTIPKAYLNAIARRGDIEELAGRLARAVA